MTCLVGQIASKNLPQSMERNYSECIKDPKIPLPALCSRSSSSSSRNTNSSSYNNWFLLDVGLSKIPVCLCVCVRVPILKARGRYTFQGSVITRRAHFQNFLTTRNATIIFAFLTGPNMFIFSKILQSRPKSLRSWRSVMEREYIIILLPISRNVNFSKTFYTLQTCKQKNPSGREK